MSDKLVLAGNSMSDNATTVERKCLTDHRGPDECPTKQQVGNSAGERNRRDKTERDLGVQSAGKFDDSELDSTAPSPYLTNVCEAVELVFKVLAASSAVPNSQTVRH